MVQSKWSKISGRLCALIAIGCFGAVLVFELLTLLFPPCGYIVLVASVLTFLMTILALIKNNLTVHLTFAVGFMMVFSLLFFFLSMEHIHPPVDYSCEVNGGVCIANVVSCENYGALNEKIFVKDPTYICKEKNMLCCLDVT